MRTFLIILITSISFQLQAQISVNNDPEPVLIGKIAPMGSTHLECTKKGDWYIFTFRDLNYKQLVEFKSFSFKDEDNAFEHLYKIISEGLENIPEDDIKIDMPGGQLTLKFTKSFGVGNVQFYYYENGIGSPSAWMTKRKIDKLFGKR